MSDEISPGDKLGLKSGGPVLTVESVHPTEKGE